MDLDLLRRLTEAHGVPGQEDAIREIVRSELADICEIRTDRLGNLHCVKRAGEGAKKLMIAAHMDEIGFVVKYIDDKGFLRIQPLGGWDPRNMASQRVFVHTKDERLNGVLMPSIKPKHMLSPEEMNRALKVEDYFVDIGLSADEVKSRVRLGDMVTMNRTLMEMGDLVTCKSMDDRAAVYVMIQAMKEIGDTQVEVHAIATVQEEVGLRGAAASGWAIEPDICIALDVTLANDIPGIPEQDHVTKLGKGAAIKFMDSSLICHPKVFAHFRDLAEQHEIPHQIEVLPMGGTDAGAVQRLHGGVPSFTLSIPTRYIHTVNETLHRDDLDACVTLLARYIEDAHSRDYGYE
jgi:putative aminopeptidase FrvX